MKTAIVFSDGIKQVMFTPENEDEKQALKMITPDDHIDLAIHTGSFGEQRFKPFTATINKCRGGYLRTFSDENSTMLVLTPKDKIQIDKDRFTLEDMRKCFDESRLTQPMIGFKHQTFEEYISSLGGEEKNNFKEKE